MKNLFKYSVLFLAPLVLLAEDVSDLKPGKRAVLIIAHKNFRDEEFDVPRRMLEAEGVDVVVASSDTSEAIGALGMKVRPDLLIEDLDPMDYDAVLLVGGPGASVYFDDEAVHERVRIAADSGRIVGAICIAPVTLARSGLLKEREATSFPSVIDELSACGARTKEAHVVVDGRIVTADGPDAADDFARSVLELLRED